MRSTKALALALCLLIAGPIFAVEIGQPMEPIEPGAVTPAASVPTVPTIPTLPAPIGQISAPSLDAAAPTAAPEAAQPQVGAAPAEAEAQIPQAQPAAPQPAAQTPTAAAAQAPAIPAAAPLQTLAGPKTSAGAGRLVFDNQKGTGEPAASEAPVPAAGSISAPAGSAPLAPAGSAAAPAAPSVPAPAPAAAPARIESKIIIGPGTFQLKNFIDLSDPVFLKRLQAARDAKDTAKINLLIAAYTPISPSSAKMAYGLAIRPADWVKIPPAERKARGDAFAQAMPQLLKNRLEQALKANDATAETVDGDITVYTVADGVKFWTDLLNAGDSDEHLAASVYLSAPKILPDHAARVVNLVNPSLQLKSQLIDSRDLSEADMAGLGAAAKAAGLQAARHGPYILVGGGISFYVANTIFDAADALKDPALAARFARVTRFVANQGIPIAYSNMPGAVAFYTPMGDEMNYVLPASSSQSLNATAHELNHARFRRFLTDLQAWTSRRNLAVPYEIDGPSAPFSPFGAFMTLLNELNSWRIGQSFDGGMKDKDILKILLNSYGGEAGWSNVQLFSKVWTAKAIQGKSVPRLILDHVRALNALDAAGMEQLGQTALSTRDVIATQNFLRLADARYPNGQGMPANLAAILAQLRPAAPAPAPAAAPVAPAAPASTPKAFDADFVISQLSRTSFLGLTDPAKVATAKQFLLWRIVKRALTLDDPAEPGRQAAAVKLVSDLFDKWGFAPLYGDRALASLNGMQKSMDQSAGRPPSPEVKNRPVQKDHVFFSPWLVGMITETLFDGNPGNHRAGMVELLRSRIYPEEMGALVKGLVYFLVKDTRTKQTLNELMVARMFLSAPAFEFFPTQRAWGDAAADAMRADPDQFAGMVESLAEYYRIGLGPVLPGSSWGQYASTRLDAAQRAIELSALGETSQNPSDWSRYEKARDTLWSLLSHPSPLARTAARYAIAGHPAYMIGLEQPLAQVLNGPASPLRLEAVALVSMTQPGFLPAVDAALARKDFAPTPDEARLLLPRQDMDARGVWKP